jgi:glyoxylase-like metal-dependent hydrolase (beta-lactamase superfamily II)
VLQVLDGEPIARTARAFGASATTVTRLREVDKSTGLRALETDQPRRVPAPLAAENVRAILHDTLQAKPGGATHWSARTMAQRHGVSQSPVQRLWHANGLKPHLTRTFKLSRDPKFAEKVIDVALLRASSMRVHATLETHAQADHLSGSQYLRTRFGGAPRGVRDAPRERGHERSWHLWALTSLASAPTRGVDVHGDGRGHGLPHEPCDRR